MGHSLRSRVLPLVSAATIMLGMLAVICNESNTTSFMSYGGQ